MSDYLLHASMQQSHEPKKAPQSKKYERAMAHGEVKPMYYYSDKQKTVCEGNVYEPEETVHSRAETQEKEYQF